MDEVSSTEKFPLDEANIDSDDGSDQINEVDGNLHLKQILKSSYEREHQTENVEKQNEPFDNINTDIDMLKSSNEQKEIKPNTTETGPENTYFENGKGDIIENTNERGEFNEGSINESGLANKNNGEMEVDGSGSVYESKEADNESVHQGEVMGNTNAIEKEVLAQEDSNQREYLEIGEGGMTDKDNVNEIGVKGDGNFDEKNVLNIETTDEELTTNENVENVLPDHKQFNTIEFKDDSVFKKVAYNREIVDDEEFLYDEHNNKILDEDQNQMMGDINATIGDDIDIMNGINNEEGKHINHADADLIRQESVVDTISSEEVNVPKDDSLQFSEEAENEVKKSQLDKTTISSDEQVVTERENEEVTLELESTLSEEYAASNHDPGTLSDNVEQGSIRYENKKDDNFDGKLSETAGLFHCVASNQCCMHSLYNISTNTVSFTLLCCRLIKINPLSSAIL